LKDLEARYQILEKLGQGGMGDVYLAHDLTLDRKVALKFLSKEKRQDESSCNRILREAKAAASLDHPYICKVYEVGRTSEADFIVMEYLEGVTLRGKLIEGPLSVHDAIVYACEIAEALSHAHAKGVIHRDLKPANIMLTTAGHIKIMDFGLAKIIMATEDGKTPEISTSTYSTRNGSAVGTPMYMSPEQVLAKPVDGRSDIFTFGIVLYEMLTGIHPFSRPNMLETGHAILHENPPSLALRRQEYPELLLHILRKMLAKKPEQRYQSAHEIVTDLKELREPDPENWSGAHAFGKLHRRSAMIFVLLGVALLAMILTGYWLYWRPPPSESLLFEAKLVYSTSTEREARISPDGQWFSYLSYQDGKTKLFTRNMSAQDPVQRETTGDPVSHVWSSDGNTLACWIYQEGDKSRLDQMPALYKESPKPFLSLDELGDPAARTDLAKSSTRVLCWIGDRIYVQGENSIWTIDQKTKAVQLVLKKTVLGLKTTVSSMRGISIRSDEKKIAFEANDDIWMADLDGKNPVRLTTNTWREFSPCWIKRNNEWRIIYSSNQFGQLDLWEVAPNKPEPTQLATRGDEEIRVEDISQDGSKVLCLVIKDEANLYCYEAALNRSVPVTTGSLSDFSPTIAAGAKRLAFQRIKQKLIQGSRLLDTEIYSDYLEKLPLDNPQRILEGSYPRLSPDGRWLAYLVHKPKSNTLDKPKSSTIELRLHDFSTQKDSKISDGIRAVISDVPLEWLADVVWSADSSKLFFVEEGEGKRMVLKMRSLVAEAAGIPPNSTVMTGNAEEMIMNPRPTEDGKNLAYCVKSPGTPPKWEIRRRDLASGRELALLSESGFYRGLYCLGWKDQSVLAFLSYRLEGRGDPSSPLKILKIERPGLIQEVGQFERAYGDTARLDSGGQVLYLTVVENDISNITAFYPTSGKKQQLTYNQRADTTFSGLVTCASGRLFYSQQKHVSDIYLYKFDRK
jgi:Tol biopolymer transport system component/predicted Ser/Thr protein kinase